MKGGGNTIHGVSFSIDKPESYQNEARVEAIKDAAAKAELYAKAVGYKVKRIVTISELDYSPRPVPMMARMQVQDRRGVDARRGRRSVAGADGQRDVRADEVGAISVILASGKPRDPRIAGST